MVEVLKDWSKMKEKKLPRDVFQGQHASILEVTAKTFAAGWIFEAAIV